MRESLWRGFLTYYYIVIAMWGLFAFLFTPVSIEDTLGGTYTMIWTVGLMVGGAICALGAAFGAIRFKRYQIFQRLEMIASVAIVLSVFLYDASLWAQVGSGTPERIGLAVAIHLLAVVPMMRFLSESAKIIRAIYLDWLKRNLYKRAGL